MIHGSWKTATVAISGTTSDEVDLGKVYREVLVIIPALDNASVTIHIAKDKGGTVFTTFRTKPAATGDTQGITTASTTAKAVIFDCGVQFLKIVCGAAQSSAARTFYLRGLN